MKHWFRMEAAADDATVVDIHIIDFIGDWIDDYWGFGVTAKSFIEQLSKLPENVKTIRVHINSPGGDVFSAANIANALREQQASKGRTVVTIVDGLAASAATVVMMAGSTVRIADNAMIMVHNPWTIAVGNAAQMRKLADDLDKIAGTIVATYKWHSKLTDEELRALMDAETWMDADEAIANGFATEKTDGLKAAASLDARALDKLKVPDKYRARVEALVKQPAQSPAVAAAADVLRLCREGECLNLAEELIAQNATIEAVNAAITTDKQQRAEKTARATQIRSLCATARLPELADSYITGAMPVDAVRAQMTILTAKLDAIEVDNSLPPDPGGRPRAGLSATEIYNQRNGLTTTKKE